MSDALLDSDPDIRKHQVIQRLNLLKDAYDREVAHLQADSLLLALIDDPDVSRAFTAVPRWYA